MTVPKYFAPRRWTPSDDDKLKSLAASGMSLRSTAIRMNRSFLAVQSRAAKLEVRFVRRSSQSDHESLAAGFIARLAPREDGSKGGGEVIDDNPNEAYDVVRSEPGPLPPQVVDVPFLITASELRDRKAKRRRKQDDLPGRSEAIRRLVELGLKAKRK